MRKRRALSGGGDQKPHPSGAGGLVRRVARADGAGDRPSAHRRGGARRAARVSRTAPRRLERSRMIRRLLIANRGEIAIRVARGARELGISPVGVYSDADEHALFRSAMDASLRIGPGPAAESYLDGERIVAAAKTLGADAIHPGYGFLSERAPFAA